MVKRWCGQDAEVLIPHEHSPGGGEEELTIFEPHPCVDIIVRMYGCELKILSRHPSSHCDVIYCSTSVGRKEMDGMI